MKQSELLKKLTRLSKASDADLYIFSSEMAQDKVDTLRNLIEKLSNRQPNACLFLCTYGGDADAAYRLASCFRRLYKHVTVYVCGMCKSAGTLALLGANVIVMHSHAELGPLDVQMTKRDELIPATSGLDIFQALAVISNAAFESFERYFLSIISHSQGNISAKTSAEIARELAVGLFAPMTAQIDPERLGEVQRAINIANAYGERLNRGILKAGGLQKLVQGYPSHSFVIDMTEAQTIFNNVRAATATEAEVASLIPGLRRPGSQPIIGNLIQMFTPSKVPAKGSPHVSKPKAKGAAKAPSGAAASPAASGGNVAPLRGDAAGDAKPAETDSDTTVVRQSEPTGRRSRSAA